MDIYVEVVKAQKQKKNFALLTVVKTEGAVPRHESSKMLVFPDGSIIGTIGGGAVEARAIEDAKDAIRKKESILNEYNLHKSSDNNLDTMCGGSVQVFIEVHNSRPHLIICGAGHVGKALSSLASTLNFEITVVDNRDEWANTERFPEADNIVVQEGISSAIKSLPITEDTYIVIATWGHKHDKTALESALGTNARYIGMMGSREKITEIFEQIRSEGIEENLLNDIYTPIGLDLKAETPQEIALSIMAEIMMVKNNASGQSLSSLK